MMTVTCLAVKEVTPDSRDVGFLLWTNTFATSEDRQEGWRGLEGTGGDRVTEGRTMPQVNPHAEKDRLVTEISRLK